MSDLPKTSEVQPQGDYCSAVLVGQTVVSAGITPRDDQGVLIAVGPVGAGGLSPEDARDLAHAAGLRAVAACRQVLPEGACLSRALVLTVYVCATENFTGHTAVADGASQAIRDQLGVPAPARAAVGVASLPGGAPVEVQLTCGWTSWDGGRTAAH